MSADAAPAAAKPALPPWHGYTVKKWKIERLKPYERNARTHPPKQIAQIRASLREFGWTQPLLVREDGTIIAGHGRLEAAIAEGYTHAPVIVAVGWDDKQCRDYTLRDNRIALNSGWDGKLLGAELADLKSLGTDLKAIGFSESELARYNPLGGVDGLAAQVELQSLYQILIECADEAQQLALLTKMQADGIKCRALIA